MLNTAFYVGPLVDRVVSIRKAVCSMCRKCPAAIGSTCKKDVRWWEKKLRLGRCEEFRTAGCHVDQIGNG